MQFLGGGGRLRDSSLWSRGNLHTSLPGPGFMPRGLHISLGELSLAAVRWGHSESSCSCAKGASCLRPDAQGLSEKAEDSQRSWARAVTPAMRQQSRVYRWVPSIAPCGIFVWQPLMETTSTPLLGFQASEAYLIKQSSWDRETRQQQDGSKEKSPSLASVTLVPSQRVPVGGAGVCLWGLEEAPEF